MIPVYNKIEYQVEAGIANILLRAHENIRAQLLLTNLSLLRWHITREIEHIVYMLSIENEK